jgi:hypothetical protein
LGFPFYCSFNSPLYFPSLQSSLVPKVCIQSFFFLVGFVTSVLSAFLLQMGTFEENHQLSFIASL